MRVGYPTCQPSWVLVSPLSFCLGVSEFWEHFVESNILRICSAKNRFLLKTFFSCYNVFWLLTIWRGKLSESALREDINLVQLAQIGGITFDIVVDGSTGPRFILQTFSAGGQRGWRALPSGGRVLLQEEAQNSSFRLFNFQYQYFLINREIGYFTQPGRGSAKFSFNFGWYFSIFLWKTESII